MNAKDAGGWRGEEEERGACARIGRAFAAVDGVLVEFITGKVLVQAQLFFDLMSANDWASSAIRDAPNDYMRRIVEELLAPGLQTLRLGPPQCSADLAPALVAGVLERLLHHLLNIRARISWQGAKRLEVDIQYVENWIQTSWAVAAAHRRALLELPIFSKCRQVLALLLPPKLTPEEINASTLGDKHAWVARRSRAKRGLFC